MAFPHHGSKVTEPGGGVTMAHYFTFGTDHVGRDLHSLGNSYARIEARNADEARVIMALLRGRKWSHQYDSAEKAGVDEFRLMPCPMENLFLDETLAPRGFDDVLLTS